MTKVHYSSLASRDLIENAEFIARDKPMAALDWIDQITRACDLLADNPEVGEARATKGHDPCRSFVAGNYVIFFRPVTDGIEVIRVVRGERDIDLLKLQ